VRPDNAPIVPVITSSSSLAFVTLRGGGLLVVDPRATPMRVRADYDRATVRGSGLTGVQAGNHIVVNSGAGFFAYRFSPEDVAATNAPNQPAPTPLIADPATNRDGHGMVATGRGRFVWISDRGMNVAEVLEVSSGRRTTVNLTGALSADPAPDLADASPGGDLLFIALRGAIPLSGGAIATGSTPGLSIVKLSESGDAGTLQAVLRVSNVDAAGTDRADVHAVRVRVKPAASAARIAVARLGRLIWGVELHAQAVPPVRVVPRAAAEVPQECEHGRAAH
jgi:hypothetical protein